MNVYSLGQIARMLDTPWYRVRYVILSRRIQPAGRVGSAKAFDQAAVEQIRKALGETAAGRWGKASRSGPAAEPACA